METMNELFLFLFVIMLSLLFMPQYHPIDTSLYKFLLYKDIINVFWIKGGFEENFTQTNLDIEDLSGYSINYEEGDFAYTSYFPVFYNNELVGFSMRTIYIKKV